VPQQAVSVACDRAFVETGHRGNSFHNTHTSIYIPTSLHNTPLYRAATCLMSGSFFTYRPLLSPLFKMCI
jgi:hypothetical protein